MEQITLPSECALAYMAVCMQPACAHFIDMGVDSSPLKSAQLRPEQAPDPSFKKSTSPHSFEASSFSLYVVRDVTES